MVDRNTLVDYLDSLLKPRDFKDYCPNGLQIEGKKTIRKLVTGVTANQALIDAAVKCNADALLVHHGFFWKNEPVCLTGIKYNRIKTLILNELNLLAYHLPLDAHPAYGNNITLAALLNIKCTETFEVEPGLYLGYLGNLTSPLSPEQFSMTISSTLKRTPLHIPGSKQVLSKIAWCTGGAQDYISQAIQHDIDAYITGEVSERTVHIARENDIHFFAAGHHATERYGVMALGEHLAEQFQLQHSFIDIDNPV